MDDKTRQRQELDQSLATMAEDFPPLWRRLYLNCLREGFDEAQSLRLVTAIVHGMAGGKLAQ